MSTYKSDDEREEGEIHLSPEVWDAVVEQAEAWDMSEDEVVNIVLDKQLLSGRGRPLSDREIVGEE